MAVELVLNHGHEIGSNGYSHEIDRAFDILYLEEQIEELEKTKNAIEPIEWKIKAFRDPLKINNDTIKALAKQDLPKIS